MSPTRNPIRASITSADGVAGVSMEYIISRPGIPLWTRKGVCPKGGEGDCCWFLREVGQGIGIL